MAASQISSARCSRAQPACEYRSTDSMNSIYDGDGILARAAEVLVRQGASGGSAPGRIGAGVAALVACWIGTVGTGSMECPGETSNGETLRVRRGCRGMGAGLGTVGGVGSVRSKP